MSDELFDPTPYIDGAVKPKRTRKPRAKSQPTVRLGGNWIVIAYAKNRSPLAHYMLAPAGQPIHNKGGGIMGYTQVATLACGGVGRTFEVDFEEFDACETCLAKVRDKYSSGGWQ